MSSVWDKLFGNGPARANDPQHLPVRYGAEEEASEAAEASPAGRGLRLRRGGDPTPQSQRVARTFDSIGRRNEALRAHLDAVEFSFRNIEAIQTQFHETLLPIDQTLAEIERAKIAQVE